MLIVVDTHSGIPVFRQLMDQIRFQVASGVLAPGDELPSTRALSAELGINPMTVSKAYGLLEQEGIVERRPGLPLVVRRQDDAELENSRREQLRVNLLPVATMAKQLGIEPSAALELFEALLEAHEDHER
jgi:GntR family transcriptional regulator